MRQKIKVIWEIIKKEFYQIRRDKRMLGVSIISPITQVLLLGYAATTDIKHSNLVVCDMDRTAESRTFVKEFTTSNYFIEKYSVDVPDEAERRWRSPGSSMLGRSSTRAGARSRDRS